jgi:predicted Rdx family selenoprotein
MRSCLPFRLSAAKTVKLMLGARAMTRVSISSITMSVSYTLNLVRKKLEAYISDVVVLKNQLPSHFRKLHSKFSDDNKYYNEHTDELVQFPRSGAFEVFFDGVLIFSKIQSNLWPCHNRIIDLVQTMIEEKKEGGQVDKFSIENRIFNDSDELFRQTYNKVIQREFKAQEAYLKGLGGLAKSNVQNSETPLGSPVKSGIRFRKHIGGTSSKKKK